MDVEALVLDKAWMRKDERAFAEWFVPEMMKVLAQRGVEKELFMVLRVKNVLAMYFVVCRAEEHVLGGRNGGKADKSPNAAAFEVLAKAYERLGKAMTGFEEALARLGKPMDAGIADVMKPILMKAEGVLENALEYEAGKRKKAAAKGKKRRT